MRRVLVVLLLLLAGCGMFGTKTPEESIHVGTQGLVLTLDTATPPQKIFMGDPFSLVGTIANKGAADVDNGVLSVGIEDDFVAMDGPRVKQVRLTGRSALNPMGQTQTLRLDMTSKALPAMTETVTTNILLSLCYPYKTVASVPVCLDTDLENKVKNKPCTMGSVSLGGGQGGPVGVSRVDQAMRASEDTTKAVPMFTITVDNLGDGQVLAPESVADACTGKPVQGMNHANVHVFLVDQELSCSKQGTATVSFQPGQNVVRCSLPDGITKTAGAYNSVLRVEVDYGYSSTVSRQVQIVRGR
jgi:hypothetical protein